jgi:hypothetical protein
MYEADDFMKVSTFYEPHGEEGAPLFVDSHVVDRDDAGMVELPGDMSLFRETDLRIRSSTQGDLHREIPSHDLIADVKDPTHSAARNFAQQRVPRWPGIQRGIRRVPSLTARSTSVGVRIWGHRRRGESGELRFAALQKLSRDLGLVLGKAREVFR